MKYILIGIVAAAIVVAGVVFWWSRQSANNVLTPPAVVNTNTAPSKTPPPAAAPTDQKPNATVNVAELLSYNKPNPTPAEMQDFTNRVASASVAATSLDISSCNPNPPVLKVNLKDSFSVVNKDAVPHKIFHGKGLDVEIGAKSTKTITPPFTQGGIYGYSCDNKINGIIFVVQ